MSYKVDFWDAGEDDDSQIASVMREIVDKNAKSVAKYYQEKADENDVVVSIGLSSNDAYFKYLLGDGDEYDIIGKIDIRHGLEKMMMEAIGDGWASELEVEGLEIIKAKCDELIELIRASRSNSTGG